MTIDYIKEYQSLSGYVHLNPKIDKGMLIPAALGVICAIGIAVSHYTVLGKIGMISFGAGATLSFFSLILFAGMKAKDPRKKENLFNELLLYACEHEDLEIVKWLVEKGKANIDYQDQCTRQTPLHYATIKENAKIVEYLLSKNANVRLKDKAGRIPLHYASQKPNATITDKLIKQGSEEDCKVKDESGLTPLDLCLDSVIKLFYSHN